MEISADNRLRELEWGGLTAEQRAAAQLSVMLRVNQGEVPYDRTRGLDPALAGTAVGLSDPEIRREVDRAMKWLPGLKLKALEIKHLPDGAIELEATAEM